MAACVVKRWHLGEYADAFGSLCQELNPVVRDEQRVLYSARETSAIDAGLDADNHPGLNAVSGAFLDLRQLDGLDSDAAAVTVDDVRAELTVHEHPPDRRVDVRAARIRLQERDPCLVGPRDCRLDVLLLAVQLPE